MKKHLSLSQKYEAIQEYTTIKYSKKQLQSISKAQKQEISKYYKAIHGGVIKHKDGKKSIIRGLFSGKDVTKFNVRKPENKKEYTKHLKKRGFKNAGLSKLKVLPRHKDERILFNRGKDKRMEIWKDYDFKKQKKKKGGRTIIYHSFNADKIIEAAIEADGQDTDTVSVLYNNGLDSLLNQFPDSMNEPVKGRIFQLINRSGGYGTPATTLQGLYHVIWTNLNNFNYTKEDIKRLNPVINQFQEIKRQRRKA